MKYSVPHPTMIAASGLESNSHLRDSGLVTRALTSRRAADLVAGFPRSPAYLGLAESLRRLIADGRIGHDIRLPGERGLSETLAVSRTTVTRAYQQLVEWEYAEARQGSGTFTRLPGGPQRAPDRALHPHADSRLIDLSHASPAAAPGLAGDFEQAAAELPGYLSSHGYYPTGLGILREAVAEDYLSRGLPTTPEQILITAGALSATAIMAGAFLSPGQRVVVESPVYPNACQALRQRGARLTSITVDPERGWDLPGLSAVMRQRAPAAAYLIPDHQNPTGHLMDDADRAAAAGQLARAGVLAIVDEAHEALTLHEGQQPLPFAAHAAAAGLPCLSLGSLSKRTWGGLRVGWVRADPGLIDNLLRARLGLELGVPVVEQIVAARVLAGGRPARPRTDLSQQHDALVSGLRRLLPDWRFRVPSGGLVLWCALPGPYAPALAEAAEAHGVAISAGPQFAVDGGLANYVRLPWTRPVAEIERALAGLATAWQEVQERPAPTDKRWPLVIA